MFHVKHYLQVKEMNTTLETRRISIFLALAFGISWTTALVIWLTGGLVNSPALIPGTPITLGLVLTATAFMWSPALAHILTRVLTREGWQGSGLALNFRKSWRHWFLAWLSPLILTLLGAAIYFILYPQHFDGSGQALIALQESAGLADAAVPDIPFPIIIMIGIVQAMLLAPIINSFFTFGEEFGWRAYLQPKLMPLGWRKAMLWMGLIWGVWHWPIILMGHNYGFDYPGAPWAGPLAMVWFTFVLGVFLGWVTIKGGSVWPAVIGHAVINGVASIAVLVTVGNPNPILGPLPVGILGSAAFTLVALWLFFRPGQIEAVNEDVSRETLEQA